MSRIPFFRLSALLNKLEEYSTDVELAKMGAAIEAHRASFVAGTLVVRPEAVSKLPEKTRWFQDVENDIAKVLVGVDKSVIAVTLSNYYRYGIARADKEELLDKPPLQQDVLEFFYSEQAFLLTCLASILRIAHDEQNPHKLTLRDFVEKLVAAGLEDNLWRQYHAACEASMPPSLKESFTAASKWADHNITKQSLVLEALFLLHYDYRSIPIKIDVLEYVAMLDKKFHAFLSCPSPHISYLSNVGKRLLEWSEQLWVLLMILIMQFEILLDIWRSLDRSEEKTAARLYKKHKLLHPAGLAFVKNEILPKLQRTALSLQKSPCGPLLLAWIVFLHHAYDLQKELRKKEEHLPITQYMLDLLKTATVCLHGSAPGPVTMLINIVCGVRKGTKEDSGTANQRYFKSVVKGLLWSLVHPACSVIQFKPETFRLNHELRYAEWVRCSQCQTWRKTNKDVYSLVDRSALTCNILVDAYKQQISEQLDFPLRAAYHDRNRRGEDFCAVPCWEGKSPDTCILLYGTIGQEAVAKLNRLFVLVMQGEESFALRLCQEHYDWVHADRLLNPKPPPLMPLFKRALERFPFEVEPLLEMMHALCGPLTPSDNRFCTSYMFELLSGLKTVSLPWQFSPGPKDGPLALSPADCDSMGYDSKGREKFRLLIGVRNGLQLPPGSTATLRPLEGLLKVELKEPVSPWSFIFRSFDEALRLSQSVTEADILSQSWKRLRAIMQMFHSFALDSRVFSQLQDKLVYEAHALGSFPQLMLRVLHLISTCDFQALSVVTSDSPSSTTITPTPVLPPPAQGCPLVTTTPSDPAEESQIVKSVLISATGVMTCALVSDVTEFASTIALPALIEAASALLQGFESVQGSYPMMTCMIDILRLLSPHFHHWQAAYLRTTHSSSSSSSSSSSFSSSSSSFSSSSSPSVSIHTSASPTKSSFFASPSKPSSSSSSCTALSAISSLSSGALASVDIYGLVKFICSEFFVDYQSFRYQLRAERCRLGLLITRTFLTILDTPPPTAHAHFNPQFFPNPHYGNPLSLAQFLHNLFISEPRMQKALFGTVVVSVSWIKRLAFEGKVEERESLEQLLISTFTLIRRLLRIQQAEADRSSTHSRPSGFLLAPSLHQALLDLTAPGATAGQLNIVQSIVFFACYSHNIPTPNNTLQLLALQLLTQLCRPHLGVGPPSLFGYLGSSVNGLRTTCLQLLNRKDPALKEAVLMFLAEAFEHQPGMAEALLLRRSATEEKAVEPEVEPDPSLQAGLKKYILDAEELFEKDLAVLVPVLRVILWAWHVVPELAKELGTMDSFWDRLKYCVNAEYANEQDAPPALLAVRALTLKILAAEMWQPRVDPKQSGKGSLSELLILLKDTQPKWLVKFTRCYGEHRNREKEVFEHARRLEINLSAFYTQIDLSGGGMTECVPPYDTSLLAQMCPRDGTDMASDDEEELQDLVKEVEGVNAAQCQAALELGLTRAWASFVQVLLVKRPSAVGMSPKSDLLWVYLHQLGRVLARCTREESPSQVNSLIMEEVSSLLLLFLSECVKPGNPRQRLHEAIKIYQLKTGCFGNEEVNSDYGLIRIFKLAASSLLREICLVVHKLVSDYLPSHGKKATLARDPELVELSSKAGPSASLAASLYDTTLSTLKSLFSCLHFVCHWLTDLQTLSLQHDPGRANKRGGGVSKLRDIPEEKVDLVKGIALHKACDILLPLICNSIGHASLMDVCVSLLPLTLTTLAHCQQLDEIESPGGGEITIATVSSSLATVSDCVSFLLSTLAACTKDDATKALRIIHMLISIAQSPGVRTLHITHSVILYICNNPILRPQPDNPRHEDLFRPYGPSGDRNGWHKVWCATVALVSFMLSSLHDHSFVDQAYEYLTVFHGRLTAALSLGATDLTVARLDEVEQVTGLLYELEKFSTQWRFKLPRFAQEHLRNVMLLSNQFIKLITDPPELEGRAKPMSAQEKLAAGQSKTAEGGPGTATPTPKVWREIGSPARTPSSRGHDSSSEELPPFLSPSLHKQQSFLLSSPALRSMQRSLDQAADEIAQLSVAVDPEEPEIFSQQIEYRMCVCLRNVLGFIRLLTNHFCQAGARELLYSKELAVSADTIGGMTQLEWDLALSHAQAPTAATNISSDLPAFLQKQPTSSSSASSSTDQPSAPGHFMPSLSSAPLTAPITVPSFLPPLSKPASAPLHPPLAILLEILWYCLRNLKKAEEIQNREEKQARFDSPQYLMTTYPLQKQRWLKRFAPQGPTLPSINKVIRIIMENALYILLQHVEVFLSHHLQTFFPGLTDEELEGVIERQELEKTEFLRQYKERLGKLHSELSNFVAQGGTSPLVQAYLAHDFPPNCPPSLQYAPMDTAPHAVPTLIQPTRQLSRPHSYTSPQRVYRKTSLNSPLHSAHRIEL